MTAPNVIRQLVQRFDEHRSSYRSGVYNEAQARLEFIDPLFEVLGWDMFNKQGYAETYKDVIHEDAIQVGGAAKAPDYAFRVGGARKFFVEAKKPSVNVKDDISPAYQLRRYAWSAKLPLSILTDFEEFAVYDCRARPDKTDKASTGRVKFLMYTDYEEKWDEIAAIFSREAVLKGSFDKYAEGTKGKHGTTDVDDAFLTEIERWRDLLARNIALRNPQLSQRDLNYAVQMTIDRIIFLRICEDRGIERYGQLQALLNGGDTYPRLCQLFHKADQRYNSGLFHFRQEKGQADAPDLLTPTLSLDDKPFKDILGNLYYPDSPYEFSVLPADILGQVYERFLGKVIRLTAGHHAVVEDKPEVKKAGGVFYTPTFIVEYIVKNTLGKLLEGKKPGNLTPKRSVAAFGGEVRSAPIRILDMACGSGSFLLGAYQYLLDWYLAGYTAAPEKWAKGKAPKLYQTTLPSPVNGRGGSSKARFGGEGWKLTTAERKRILLDHIYGVDIDSQAVEVTKLSLLLKVLEGESEQTLVHQLTFLQERALPDLSHNIKCGNSLIGPDFYTSRPSGSSKTLKVSQAALPGFDLEEQYRINAFDWRKEFPAVFTAPPLNAASLRPPPHRKSGDGEGSALPPSAVSRGGEVEGGDGFGEAGGFDVIIGNPPYGAYFSDVEKVYIKKNYRAYQYRFDSYVYFIEKALTLGKVFGCISFITPELWLKLENNAPLRQIISQSAGFDLLKVCGENVFSNAVINTIIFRLQKGIHVDNLQIEKGDDVWFMPSSAWEQANRLVIDYRVKPSEGLLIVKVKTAAKHILSDYGDTIQGITPYDKYRGQSEDLIKRRGYHFQEKKDDTCGKWLFGKDVSRYELGWSGEWLSYGPWLAAPRAPRFFNGYRLLFREVPGAGKRIQATITDETLYHGHSVTPFKPLQDIQVNLKYLLGLANSKLLSWYGGLTLSNFGKDIFPKLNPQDIKALPIRSINFSDPAEVQRHDRMVALVDRMLALHRQLAAARTPAEKTMLQRQIDATDRQIDTLVYALYDLTEEEIRVAEGK